jgi:hypothetical protein
MKSMSPAGSGVVWLMVGGRNFRDSARAVADNTRMALHVHHYLYFAAEHDDHHLACIWELINVGSGNP